MEMIPAKAVHSHIRANHPARATLEMHKRSGGTLLTINQANPIGPLALLLGHRGNPRQ